MQPAVLIGPSLSTFIASNFALLSPTLVTIPGGTFMMGAGRVDAHPATVSTFRMGRDPVTNEEYARYLSALGPNRFALLGSDILADVLGVIAIGPSEGEVRSAVTLAAEKVTELLVTGGLLVRGNVRRNVLDLLHIVQIRDHRLPSGLDGPRQPVVFKNWEEAFLYASLHGGRLPTEWEWEFAARAVTGKKELRDYATQSGRLIPSEAHYDRSSTASVDDPRYQPLENGLSHMTGNVAEWMQNRYGDYPKEAVVDPIGPLGGQYRGLRGGSWHDNDPEKLMASFRNYYTPDRGLADVGFRVIVETK